MQTSLVVDALKGVHAVSGCEPCAKIPITLEVLRFLCQALVHVGFSHYQILCFLAIFFSGVSCLSSC